MVVLVLLLVTVVQVPLILAVVEAAFQALALHTLVVVAVRVL